MVNHKSFDLSGNKLPTTIVGNKLPESCLVYGGLSRTSVLCILRKRSLLGLCLGVDCTGGVDFCCC